MVNSIPAKNRRFPHRLVFRVAVSSSRLRMGVMSKAASSWRGSSLGFAATVTTPYHNCQTLINRRSTDRVGACSRAGRLRETSPYVVERTGGLRVAHATLTFCRECLGWGHAADYAGEFQIINGTWSQGGLKFTPQREAMHGVLGSCDQNDAVLESRYC